MIHIALSSDINGFDPNATLLASIVRRTNQQVRVRFYTRDFQPPDFKVRNLEVEFRKTERNPGGKYPRHVTTAAFDRLYVLQDEHEWDRCLIMDHDMIVLRDLKDYFEMGFDGHLMMGRLFEKDVNLKRVVEEWRGRKLPEAYKHCANYPFFCMGPMLNLKGMRESGGWQKFKAAHETLDDEEQISLAIASDGRIKGVHRSWNILPEHDNLGEYIPEGIIHWTGPAKPWQRGAQVWKPEIWEAEKCTWEALRCGEWEKPVAWELAPAVDDLLALGARGWQVYAFSANQRLQAKARKFGTQDLAIAPINFSTAPPETYSRCKRPHFIRAKNFGQIRTLLKEGVTSEYAAVKHPFNSATVRGLKSLGYSRFAVVTRSDHPPGGAAAEGLDYDEAPEMPEIGSTQGQELHAVK